MKPLMPSEVARLVYGYLMNEKNEETAKCFLKSTPCLTECYQMFKINRDFNINVNGFNLHEIVDLFGTMCSMIEERISVTCESKTLIEKLQYLLDSNHISTKEDKSIEVKLNRVDKCVGNRVHTKNQGTHILTNIEANKIISEELLKNPLFTEIISNNVSKIKGVETFNNDTIINYEDKESQIFQMNKQMGSTLEKKKDKLKINIESISQFSPKNIHNLISIDQTKYQKIPDVTSLDFMPEFSKKEEEEEKEENYLSKSNYVKIAPKITPMLKIHQVPEKHIFPKQIKYPLEVPGKKSKFWNTNIISRLPPIQTPESITIEIPNQSSFETQEKYHIDNNDIIRLPDDSSEVNDVILHDTPGDRLKPGTTINVNNKKLLKIESEVITFLKKLDKITELNNEQLPIKSDSSKSQRDITQIHLEQSHVKTSNNTNCTIIDLENVLNHPIQTKTTNNKLFTITKTDKVECTPSKSKVKLLSKSKEKNILKKTNIEAKRKQVYKSVKIELFGSEISSSSSSSTNEQHKTIIINKKPQDKEKKSGFKRIPKRKSINSFVNNTSCVTIKHDDKLDVHISKISNLLDNMEYLKKAKMYEVITEDGKHEMVYLNLSEPFIFLDILSESNNIQLSNSITSPLITINKTLDDISEIESGELTNDEEILMPVPKTLKNDVKIRNDKDNTARRSPSIWEASFHNYPTRYRDNKHRVTNCLQNKIYHKYDKYRPNKFQHQNEQLQFNNHNHFQRSHDQDVKREFWKDLIRVNDKFKYKNEKVRQSYHDYVERKNWLKEYSKIMSQSGLQKFHRSEDVVKKALKRPINQEINNKIPAKVSKIEQ
ncbi:uncharacterized protein LOC113560292 [Rhopalosiphum maidis]|uniref:uncharacterized protein LOC113560292 n=1 Tax=Rhopalosiphum maidis TaxID=43146 RepID=UPI000F0099C5|nr:uncharacterized protein LOC113560292 [Rhopalosiphum maidis]